MTKTRQKATELEDALKIFEATQESARSLFLIYDKEKGNKRGSATDQQQDILRAVLLLVCAGFDSFLKQLVEDTLEIVKNKNRKSRDFFTREASGLIKLKDSKEISADVIANALMSGDPQLYFFQRIQRKLSEHSLQSYKELQNILEAFGLNRDQFADKKVEIHKMFSVRNLMAHDFDYDFSKRAVGVKNRIQRKKEEIEGYTNLSITIMQMLLDLVNQSLLGK